MHEKNMYVHWLKWLVTQIKFFEGFPPSVQDFLLYYMYL